MQFLQNLPTILELFDGSIILDSLSLPMFLGRIGIGQILRRWGVNLALRTTHGFSFRASNDRDRSGCPSSTGRSYFLSNGRSRDRRRDGDRRLHLLDNNGGFRFLENKQTNQKADSENVKKTNCGRRHVF